MHAYPASSSSTVRAHADRGRRSGHAFFTLQASGFARALPQQAWRVLTDYERLPEFIPDLQSSTVLSRHGETTLIEQRSTAGFLFFSQPIHIVVQAVEHPYSSIELMLVSGDLRRYEARWELAPHLQQGWQGTRVNYAGMMEPDFPVPPLIGTGIVRANVQKMMEATLAEIERRGAH
jgi:ribosome-associated toxin RatA of RatAB toxin-antitoxin module